MTILKRSAQLEGMKVSSMSAEIQRRLKTTSEYMKGYMRVMRKVRNGEVSRNREGYMTKSHRRYKKLCEKTEWYLDHDTEA